MPIGRHRHAINVRTDGLASVLGPLLQDPAVQAALLVDVDSGMVLDACGLTPDSDQEQLGAAHADLLRLAFGPAFGIGQDTWPPDGECEIVVSWTGHGTWSCAGCLTRSATDSACPYWSPGHPGLFAGPGGGCGWCRRRRSPPGRR